MWEVGGGNGRGGEPGWYVKYMKKINKNGMVIKTHPLYEILYFIFMPKL